MILETAVDRFCFYKGVRAMSQLQQIIKPHSVVEAAMHPIARISSRLALLLLLAGNGPAASSRLVPLHARPCARGTGTSLCPARQLEIRTLGRIQLRFLG
jgi:hypothetical protein